MEKSIESNGYKACLINTEKGEVPVVFDGDIPLTYGNPHIGYTTSEGFISDEFKIKEVNNFSDDYKVSYHTVTIDMFQLTYPHIYNALKEIDKAYCYTEVTDNTRNLILSDDEHNRALAIEVIKNQSNG